jgi:hypothetical protein
VAFLQKLKDALQKHTNVVPESQEEGIVLKDKFLTQSAPNIHREFQNWRLKGARTWASWSKQPPQCSVTGTWKRRKRRISRRRL